MTCAAFWPIPVDMAAARRQLEMQMDSSADELELETTIQQGDFVEAARLLRAQLQRLSDRTRSATPDEIAQLITPQFR